MQFSGWTLYSVLYYMIEYGLTEKTIDTKNTIGFFITYVIGFLVTILFREIYTRVFARTKNIGSIVLTVAISAVLGSIVWLLVDRLVSTPLWGWQQFWKWMREPFFWQLRMWWFNTFTLITWSSLYFFIKFWDEWNVERDRSEKARLLAQSAQLQMLRYQLNPHFLFNSLNSIRALVEEDRGKARDMITELAELLRYSLTSQKNGDVPLSTELEAIQHYFAIEEKRFEDNLKVTYDIDPLAEDFPVPSFLLHPLVENAVKYGMQTSKMPLEITITATVSDQDLRLTVWNSGEWVKPERPERHGTGTGLENIRQRLENAFPGKYSFDTSYGENGVTATISIRRELS
jgi:hypothetical protein